MTDTRESPQAAEVVARFRAQGYEPAGLHALRLRRGPGLGAGGRGGRLARPRSPVIEVMHSREFDTVLGRIGFDAKGDVTGFEPWGWYVWQADGTYVPLGPVPAGE